MMANVKNTELPSERRCIVAVVNKSQDQCEKHFWASRRARRIGWISRHKLTFWLLSLAVIFFIYLAYFGIKMHFHGGWHCQRLN